MPTSVWTTMLRLALLSTLVSVQYLGCLANGRGPNVLEMLLEGINSLQLTSTNWKYIMPDNTDVDQDGNISDREIEHKFDTYMADLFEMMDQNQDKIVTEQELKSLRFDLSGLNKVLDAVFETFPVKPLLLAADVNRDGIWDENDFYLPEYSAYSALNPPYIQSSTSQTNNSGVSDLRLRLIDEGMVWINNDGVCQIGQNEGNVICRDLGFRGLDYLKDEYAFGYKTSYSSQKYICSGNEDKLEHCQRSTCDRYREGAMGVVCEEELGALRLIGGKDSSSGDIFLGNRALGCAPYRSEEWSMKQAKVICRELGFPGVAKITRGAEFTKKFRPRTQTLKIKKFDCQGNETRLTDCKFDEDGPRYPRCDRHFLQGVVCSKTDCGKQTADDLFLEKITNWREMWKNWELFGRNLFIADANKDGKLSLEEIKSKFAQYLAVAFQFVDQTGDGHVSIEDFTTLQMSVGPIHKVMDVAFDGQPEGIDLLQTMKYWNQQLSFTRVNINNWDLNNDTKLSAEDLSFEEPFYILPLLSQKVDKNQDGKLQRDEVREFTKNMFKKVDIDGDGVLTFEDVLQLIQDNGFCISLLQWRSFLPKATEFAKTQFRALMSYVFKELDEDGNGEIGLKEFQGLHIPCAVTRDEVSADPSRIRCYEVFGRFFFRNREALGLKKWIPTIFIPRYGGYAIAESACKWLS